VDKIIRIKKKFTSTMMAILLLLLAAIPAFAATYTYDGLNRLVSATYDNGQKINYTYDAGGNMLTAGATSVAYHVYGDVLLNGAGKSGTTVSITGGDIDFNGYIFSGMLKPIREDGTSVFRLGRSIPVKFRLKDANGNFISNATARLYLSRVENGVPGKEMEATPSGKANKGNYFRYKNQGHKYIYNLNTRDLTAGTWRFRILLDDGASHYVNIGLKEPEKHQGKIKEQLKNLQDDDQAEEDEDKDEYDD